MRPLCSIEGCTNLAKKAASIKSGYANKCSTHLRGPKGQASRLARRRPWALHKKEHCESPDCQWTGRFIPYQLQVDHIDGDKNNNNPSNLMTLCGNCHDMKTWLNQEYNKPGKRGKNAVHFADTIEVTISG